MQKLIEVGCDDDDDRGEPIRLIEFGALRGILFFVAVLFSGAVWLAGLWQVGKWVWALL